MIVWSHEASVHAANSFWRFLIGNGTDQRRDVSRDGADFDRSLSPLTFVASRRGETNRLETYEGMPRIWRRLLSGRWYRCLRQDRRLCRCRRQLALISSRAGPAESPQTLSVKLAGP